MKLIHYITRKISWQLVLAIFTLLALGASIGTPVITYAVTENRDNIRQKFLDDMTAWGQDNQNNNNLCGYASTKFNTAQDSWVSEASDPTDELINIVPGTNTVNLWFNFVAAHCNSIISGSPNYDITDETLRESRNRVKDASVTGGVGGESVTGLDEDVLRLDYSKSYFWNDRYVKEIVGNNNGPLPVHDSFQLTGLAGLPARATPYTLNVRVVSRPVNRFSSGQTYRCVVNASQNPVTGYDDTNCDTTVSTFPVKIQVGTPFSASCDVDVATDISVGTTFFANFTVTNTGTSTLNEADLTMSSANTPLGLWGKQTFPVQVDAPATTVPSSGSTTWRENGFTSPATTGSYNFKWNVLRNGVVIGSCNKGIDVSPNANRPILRVNGGDIFAGADFEGYDRPCENYYSSIVNGVKVGDIAKTAHINTWGILDYHWGNGKYGMLGASSSQYAVFSSGEAGYENADDDFDRSHLNHILGNDGMIQDTDGNLANGPSADPAQSVPDGTSTKDAVFANDQGKGGRYGDFYRGLNQSDWLPCVNIGAYTDSDGDDKAVTAASPNINSAYGSTAPVVKFTPTGGSDGKTLVIGAASVLNPVTSGKKKVIIVEGNIDIKGDITYPPNYADATDIPYLQIIATGKINIYKNVTRIDAHLLAFPKNLDPYDPANPGSGIIDTCADADAAHIGQWPDGASGGSIGVNANNCPNQLKVNGTLTARRIYFKRTLGTMSSDITNLDNSVPPYNCRIQDGDDGHIADQDIAKLVLRYNKCAAELVNFYPEAYISNRSSIGEDIGVQSIPINSVELPPIY